MDQIRWGMGAGEGDSGAPGVVVVMRVVSLKEAKFNTRDQETKTKKTFKSIL